MKRHIQIGNSYTVWSPYAMLCDICLAYRWKYGVVINKSSIKNRRLLIIEWWLHNIGYWLTKPFVFVAAIKRLNLRFKDVDLMVEVPTDD